jgi:hypothetical protein
MAFWRGGLFEEYHISLARPKDGPGTPINHFERVRVLGAGDGNGIPRNPDRLLQS